MKYIPQDMSSVYPLIFRVVLMMMTTDENITLRVYQAVIERDHAYWRQSAMTYIVKSQIIITVYSRRQKGYVLLFTEIHDVGHMKDVGLL